MPKSTQTTCRCGGIFKITGPMRIYECKECGASRPKSEGGAIPQMTPFSSRNRAAGIVSLWWSKLGYGLGSQDTLALQDMIENALADAYEEGRKNGYYKYTGMMSDA